MVSVLFVCTGNICRSPTAEALFKRRIDSLNVDAECDSAGTHGYHVGEAPDPRTVQTAQGREVDMRNLRARKLEHEDFKRFEYLVAMDRGHYNQMVRLAPAGTDAKVSLLLDYTELHKGQDVPDPYYGDAQGFEETFDMIEEGVDGFIKRVL